MEDFSSVASTPASTDPDNEKSKMKMKETVVSKDLHLSPPQSCSRGPMFCFPPDDSIHRRPGLELGANKPPRQDLARTNKASNDSLRDRTMNSGVYPCGFCFKQFSSYKAQVGHHAAPERERGYEKNSRAFSPSSFRNYSPYGLHPTISRQATRQSYINLLRARFEFMYQKKPLTPRTRSLGFPLHHSGLQSLQQELATKWRSSMSVDKRFENLPSDHSNKWVHLHGFTSTPGFEQADALSLELTIGRSSDWQTRTKGPTHSIFLNRQEASPNNIFIDHFGLDLTLRL